ncbi:MAG: GNAT family N-acetyltransferase [Opitutales bacterium]
MQSFSWPIKGAEATLRPARTDDAPHLVWLNRLCFPAPDEENIVWREGHLLNHQQLFPDGQIVAEVDGEVVGAVATLIVDMGLDPLRPHTYAGITDGGFFHNHDPSGDTLYGADVYVHPDWQGRGVGRALYEARRRLCLRLNLRRIIAGGRLANYKDHAARMTADEYVQQVEAGQLRDKVLSFQFSEGFRPRAVLRNYVRDAEALNHACLIEWINPEHQAVARRELKVRVACVQYYVRQVASFDDFASQVEYYVENASEEYRADFVVFPELLTVQLLSCVPTQTPQEGIRRLQDFTPRLLELFQNLARRYQVHIIGGSHPILDENVLLNQGLLFLPDGTYHLQPKLHITPSERTAWGITGGHSLRVFNTPKAKIGILICYDVEFPEATRWLADHGCDILFVPYCTDDRHGHLRVRYCAQARAVENQIYVVTTGIVGNLPSVPAMDIHYGQAGVFAPSDHFFPRDAIVAEADPNVETMLVTDLPLDDLFRARAEGSVTPVRDRRRDLFELRANIQGEVIGPEQFNTLPLDLSGD